MSIPFISYVLNLFPVILKWEARFTLFFFFLRFTLLHNVHRSQNQPTEIPLWVRTFLTTLESPQHSPMGLILPCFVSQRALIKCLLHDASVPFVVRLRLRACKLRKCRFSSSCSLERYLAQRRGSVNSGGMDDCTLAWEDVQRQAVNYLVSGSPSGYMATEPQGMLGSQGLKTIPSAPLQDLLLEWLVSNPGGLLHAWL